MFRGLVLNWQLGSTPQLRILQGRHLLRAFMLGGRAHMRPRRLPYEIAWLLPLRCDLWFGAAAWRKLRRMKNRRWRIRQLFFLVPLPLSLPLSRTAPLDHTGEVKTPRMMFTPRVCKFKMYLRAAS